MTEIKYTYYISRKTKIIAFGILLTVIGIQQVYFEAILDDPLTHQELVLSSTLWIHKKVLLWRVSVRIFLSSIYLIEGLEIHRVEVFHFKGLKMLHCRDNHQIPCLIALS